MIRTRKVFTTLAKSIALAMRTAPVVCLSLLIFKFVAAVLPTLQIDLTKELTNSVASLLNQAGNMRDCITVLVVIFIIGIFAVLIELLNQYITLLLQQKTGYRMEGMLAEKTVLFPVIRFDDSQFYDQLQRARSTITFSGQRVIDFLFSAGQSLVTLISFIVLIGQFDTLLTVAIILYMIPSLWVNMKIGKWKFWLLRLQTPFTRRMQYLFDLLTNRSSAKELRIYNLGQTLLKEWSAIYWNNAAEQKKVERRSFKARSAVESIQSLLGMLFTIYSIFVCINGNLTVGHFVAIYQILVSTQSQLKKLAFELSSLYEDALMMNEFFLFMDTNEEGQNSEIAAALQAFKGPITKGITVNNLSFRYPNRSEYTLKNISLHIKPNQTVAIVGENGAGKSTLVNCLIGLYSSYSGKIEYDGVDLKNIDKSALYRNIAAVFQDFLRLYNTPRENIGYGDIGRLSDQTALEMAAARSGASEVISSLPDGFDTRLGPEFEGGTELSVGQWQKLALGRAFFKESEIIVLDEPTASMDPIAEQSLYKRFAELSEGKITLLISHRLGSCKIADHILVLKDGELVEQGTHDELLKSSRRTAGADRLARS
ncbi:ABC-type multidrug transport system, ATPase and permease component [Thermobacillus composti KWC4]|uniref:ABC-type multidrug transport system, ATPase and permease component n=1 Tax=Thermobacillus composti (strain DSM 18247 / JCM 13945 / KWC4) TaxID=717605 RepID=L0EGH8_THECK|nr:ABC transporter ATP-binding protein [Thermobacillus composti]AGA59353.1 ABC-type multidrug transport system, ATPase and permease component [Thermobacillus composti KWC4]